MQRRSGRRPPAAGRPPNAYHGEQTASSDRFSGCSIDGQLGDCVEIVAQKAGERLRFCYSPMEFGILPIDLGRIDCGVVLGK